MSEAILKRMIGLCGLIVVVSGCASFKASQIIAQDGDPSQHTEAETDAWIASLSAGYTSALPAESIALETVELAPLTLEKNQCYTVVLRLEDGATWSDTAKSGLSFFVTPAEAWPIDPVQEGKGLHGTGAGNRLGCVQTAGTYELHILAEADRFGGAVLNSTELGTGNARLELLSRPTSDEEFATYQDRVNQDARDRAAAKKAAEGAAADQACGECKTQYHGCVGSGQSDSSCMDQWRSCTFDRLGADSPTCGSPR